MPLFDYTDDLEAEYLEEQQKLALIESGNISGKAVTPRGRMGTTHVTPEMFKDVTREKRLEEEKEVSQRLRVRKNIPKDGEKVSEWSGVKKNVQKDDEKNSEDKRSPDS